MDLHFPEHLSAEVCDLISRMLVKNPEERISLEEIKAHPWITNNANVWKEEEV